MAVWLPWFLFFVGKSSVSDGWGSVRADSDVALSTSSITSGMRGQFERETQGVAQGVAPLTHSTEHVANPSFPPLGYRHYCVHLRPGSGILLSYEVLFERMIMKTTQPCLDIDSLFCYVFSSHYRLYSLYLLLYVLFVHYTAFSVLSLKLQISQVTVSCNSISQSSYSYPDNKRALGN